MKLRTRISAVVFAAIIATPALMGASSATASPSSGLVSMGAAGGTFANCTALNKKYPHGVGKKGAKDKVSGASKPVKTFTVSTSVYNKNKKSDRDKDGIACEKK
ncbi:excalibur calcium-binding domain-containing protein [Glaciihabitans arcticus]|uniref:Excalibur calcium-binding domain-containing protein n=1 Tax=Glaciihabitans arcticus TaxID=2668039 RepID=A0A4Q9GYH4_9MICO|nr:excalibur calcium-binding domain-containing protein [Glaciihabitans arcticus]TBN57360.1 excalibur calcium-binding domain-containing protein [Glaciihabitans arcticus]